MDKITKLAVLVLLACSYNASASFMHHTDTADDDSQKLKSHQRVTDRYTIDVDAIFAEMERLKLASREPSDGFKKRKKDASKHSGVKKRKEDASKHSGVKKRKKDASKHSGVKKRKEDASKHSGVIKKKKDHSRSIEWMDDDDFFTKKHPRRERRHFESRWHESGGHHPKIDFKHHNDHVPAVPLPAAVWLFGSGLIGLIAFARKKA